MTFLSKLTFIDENEMVIYLIYFLFYQSFVSVDDVQVSCYRILNSLYFLGTNQSIYVERYKGTFSMEALFQLKGDH